MSQRNVERLIGRLVTDEAFRRQFAADPVSAVEALTSGGMELNECERRALASIDPREVERFSETLHPCIQKSDLHAVER